MKKITSMIIIFIFCYVATVFASNITANINFINLDQIKLYKIDDYQFMVTKIEDDVKVFYIANKSWRPDQPLSILYEVNEVEGEFTLPLIKRKIIENEKVKDLKDFVIFKVFNDSYIAVATGQLYKIEEVTTKIFPTEIEYKVKAIESQFLIPGLYRKIAVVEVGVALTLPYPQIEFKVEKE